MSLKRNEIFRRVFAVTIASESFLSFNRQPKCLQLCLVGYNFSWQEIVLAWSFLEGVLIKGIGSRYSLDKVVELFPCCLLVRLVSIHLYQCWHILKCFSRTQEQFQYQAVEIFLLLGAGIVLVFFYIYPIVATIRTRALVIQMFISFINLIFL